MVIDRINELRVHLLELEQAAVAKMIKLQDNTHDNTNLTRTFATESAHIHRTLIQDTFTHSRSFPLGNLTKGRLLSTRRLLSEGISSDYAGLLVVCV